MCGVGGLNVCVCVCVWVGVGGWGELGLSGCVARMPGPCGRLGGAGDGAGVLAPYLDGVGVYGTRGRAEPPCLPIHACHTAPPRPACRELAAGVRACARGGITISLRDRLEVALVLHKMAIGMLQVGRQGAWGARGGARACCSSRTRPHCVPNASPMRFQCAWRVVCGGLPQSCKQHGVRYGAPPTRFFTGFLA